jgi:hypothetical protein
MSQIIQYNIEVKINKEDAGITGEVNITVISGKADYTYYLTTNDPIKGQVIEKSEKTKKDHYTFKGVKPGTYFVKIEDSTGMYAGKSVVIKEN